MDAAAINRSMTLNACQAVTSSPPAEYQGRKLATSRPRPEMAPTSSPDARVLRAKRGATRFMRDDSVALAPEVLLHRQVPADRDRRARDQAEEQADLAISVTRRIE